MTEFTRHTIETAPQSSKRILEESEKAMGFIPNLYTVMAEAPSLLEAYKAVGGLFQKSSFNADELTVIWQSINVEHECHYCVPAHTAIAGMMNVDPAITEALRNETPLPEKLEVLREFTLSVVRNRGQVADKEIDAFLEAGYSKQQVLEVVLGVAQKVMSNYVNHLADTPVDPAFQPFEWQKKS
ncbi:carboxymuconolactone decarboxylase family protein [Endozoicomonadaceae bacterium StTr2]